MKRTRFVDLTGVDALAVAVGTSHHMTVSDVHLDIGRNTGAPQRGRGAARPARLVWSGRRRPRGRGGGRDLQGEPRDAAQPGIQPWSPDGAGVRDARSSCLPACWTRGHGGARRAEDRPDRRRRPRLRRREPHLAGPTGCAPRPRRWTNDRRHRAPAKPAGDRVPGARVGVGSRLRRPPMGRSRVQRADAPRAPRPGARPREPAVRDHRGPGGAPGRLARPRTGLVACST